MSLVRESVSTMPLGLRVVQDFAAKLRIEGLPYCHWKSNEHLEEGLLGITDLDMLFDRNASVKLARILSDCGYKRFAAVHGHGYPGVEDYLGFDHETGKIVHLHLHYQLTAGENHLKGYHLPWEQWVLSTRKLDEESQVFVSDPNMEMLLLLVRSLLKIRTRNRILGLGGRAYVRGGEIVEFRWLKERIDPERLAQITRSLLGDAAAAQVCEIAASTPTLARLVRLRRTIQPTLTTYRTYGRAGARMRRWVRELLWLRSGIGKRITQPTAPLSRTDPRGGLLIAFMGSDGSGKSTMATLIRKWLGWKIDARPVYFGSGDGPTSLMRLPLKLALRSAQRGGMLRSPSAARAGAAGSSSRGTGAGASSAAPSGTGAGAAGAAAPAPNGGGMRDRLRAVWALVLAWEKRGGVRRAWRGRNLGMIMIADRYPQNQIMGFNDGPLLSGWRGSPSGMLARAGRWESIPYVWAETNPPDIVFKLHVSPQVALSRKPDMEIEEIVRRTQAVAGLRFGPLTHIVDIDADRPLDEVLLEIKRRIWERL